ncbi:proteophosphoglycan ppg4 [Rhodotorula toruloides]|uniref:Proteophosphoglycan ppg4 n=1 Tax=Rhodotorula toruloides TaxID=5286 RepID=A0A511KLV6_RHOTO|nr:proteophosphoglycan ppg4 [Rhodotorula toruloides]
MSIGSPTGFRHVAHMSVDEAFDASAGQGGHGRARDPQADFAPLPPSLSSPNLAPKRADRLSAPAYMPAVDNALSRALVDASNRVLSTPSSPSRPPPAQPVRSPTPSTRPTSLPASPANVAIKRKPPPPVTPSVIREVNNPSVIRPQPAVATLAQASSSLIALQNLFSPSELRTAQAAVAQTSDEEDQGKNKDPAYETNTTKAFKGPMRDIEEALKREAERER